MGADPLSPHPAPRPIVLDTNILLDVFVFDDAAAQPLRQALQAGTLAWLATQPMRDEMARVLAYPKIIGRLFFYRRHASDILSSFDRHARLVAVPAKAPVTCKDADDQKFIDLAVAHRSHLLSKDRAVLSMARRLEILRVSARAAW